MSSMRKSALRALLLEWSVAPRGDTVVQLLVEKGASVNVRNARGITPLAAAMFGSTAGRARASAPAGADLLGFEPPIELAHPDTVALLKKLGAE